MIGLFGGSFDPIHHGHLIIARTVLESLGLEEVRFVPARGQPFKRGHRAAAELRADMVALAISGEPRFRLERIELDRPAPSYTVETLRELRARDPGQAFALLLGADTALEFPAWKESGEVRRLAQLVIFARSGTPIPDLGPEVTVVPVPVIEISATDIRERVRAGRSIRYLVPDPVAAFISANRLYLRDD